MASLVERETAVDAQRPLVASVFENRLARKIPLMTDPAVIYGLELDGRWRGAIYESDLKFDTSYNTYLHTVCRRARSQSGAEVAAGGDGAAKTDYLYFVAAGANPREGRSFLDHRGARAQRGRLPAGREEGRQPVKTSLRLASAAALALPLLLSGCSLIYSTRKLPIPKAPSTIQTVTPDQLVALLTSVGPRWRA